MHSLLPLQREYVGRRIHTLQIWLNNITQLFDVCGDVARSRFQPSPNTASGAYTYTWDPIVCCSDSQDTDIRTSGGRRWYLKVTRATIQ